MIRLLQIFLGCSLIIVGIAPVFLANFIRNVHLATLHHSYLLVLIFLGTTAFVLAEAVLIVVGFYLIGGKS